MSAEDTVQAVLSLLASQDEHSRLCRAAACIHSALLRFGGQGLALSFNGGKDATVLLYLTLAVYRRENTGTPLALYWRDEARGFTEVDAFVCATEQRYGLTLVRYDCGFAEGMKDAVERRGVTAVLLGTRRSDPNGADAESVQPSSAGWPPFVRVNPLLELSYADVWHFLRSLSLPYCSLYDRGFTSLGHTLDTKANPALQQADGSYLPAYELDDGSLERAGRTSKLPG